jgi:hypothetical protein
MPAACVGDCDGDRTVTISELVSGVGLALNGAAPATCAALDRNGDRQVDVSELIAAVANALAGCPAT